MLDEFMAGLSNEAQLQIALRFARLALPIWSDHFASHPEKIDAVNALVDRERRLPGAYERLQADLPAEALAELDATYESARKRSDRPARIMKESALLVPLLHTFLGPLTNPKWDKTLPRSVRLVFTSIWNILTWLLYRERNDEGETHICVSVNQSVDAMVSEGLFDFDQFNVMLREYETHTRHGDEDGERGIEYPEPKDPARLAQEAFQKIIGPVPVTDPPSRAQAVEIVRQMREEDRNFWDSWEEYNSGTSVHYSFDKEAQQYQKVEMDVIAATFMNTYVFTEEEMIEAISSYSLSDLRKGGFVI